MVLGPVVDVGLEGEATNVDPGPELAAEGAEGYDGAGEKG